MHKTDISQRRWPIPRGHYRGLGYLLGLCLAPFIVVATCGSMVLQKVGCIEPSLPSAESLDTPEQRANREAAEFRQQNPLDISFGDSPSGLLITGLDAGSVWAKAGCRLGDELVSLDGVAVGSAWDAEQHIREAGFATLKVALRRDGKPVSASVVVGAVADGGERR